MKKRLFHLPKAAGGLQAVKMPSANPSTGGLGLGADLLSTGLSLAQGGDTDAEGLPKGGSALGVLGSAANGASTGAQLGPWGAAGGAALGVGIGLLQASQADKARAAAQQQRQREVVRLNQSLTGVDTASNSQASQYKDGTKKIGKPSMTAAQDATAPRNMYKSSPSDGKGGAATLRRTAKGATAILGLAKAIPTPFTQAIGWGASALGAGMDTQDAYDAAKKGDYKGAALNMGQAALQMVSLKTKALTVANKPYNAIARMATLGSLAADAQDIAAAAGKELKNGSKAVHTKAIEIEGGEPHFSRKVDGERELKFFAPDGPKHSEGGIPVIAEGGDAIVTAKKDLGEKAVKAHMRGDDKTVEKIINQMPGDKPLPKKADGSRNIRNRRNTSALKGLQANINAGGYQLAVDGLPGQKTSAAFADLVGSNKPLLPTSGISTFVPQKLATTTVGPTAKSTLKTDGEQRKTDLSGNIMSGLQAAPTLYNLGQGLFGDVQKTTRRSYNPEMQQYQDLSAPQRQASRQAMNSQVSNARNLSGGSAGNVRSNANQAFAENATRQGAIDAQESGRRLATENQNVDSRNQAQAMNNQMNNQADDIDAQREARKQQYLTTGLEGISGLAGGALLDKNAKARDAQTATQIGGMMKNYTMVKGADGNYSWEVKKKNGARAIKVAKK